jgi:hypothetical protein
MTNPIIKIVNATTGEEIERELNSAELRVWNQDKINAETKKVEQLEKSEARSVAESKLIELGLTVEDLKALLG